MALFYKHPRGTRAALNALAASNGLVPNQIYLITDESRLAIALTTSTYETFAKQSEAGAGGSDPWTYKKLVADYTNATVTFANITDGTNILTYTPPANTDWTMDGRLLVWTTAPANLPRVGVAIAAGATRGMGGVNIWAPGATATTTVQANGAWDNANGVTVVQIAAGGVLTASVPYLFEISAHGRSGAAPTAISFQMAMETAGANIGFIKRGSFMRYRTL